MTKRTKIRAQRDVEVGDPQQATSSSSSSSAPEEVTIGAEDAPPETPQTPEEWQRYAADQQDGAAGLGTEEPGVSPSEAESVPIAAEDDADLLEAPGTSKRKAEESNAATKKMFKTQTGMRMKRGLTRLATAEYNEVLDAFHVILTNVLDAAAQLESIRRSPAMKGILHATMEEMRTSEI